MSEQISSSQGSAAAVQAKLQRGLLLQRKGRLIEAERAFRAALRQAPVNFDAHYLLGRLALQTRRAEQGAALIAKAIEFNPNVAAAHITLAGALLALDRPTEALAAYDRAIARWPDLVRAYRDRAITLKTLNRYDEALASYDQALALAPDDAAQHFNRGILLMAMKRYAEALAGYDRAIALTPDFVAAHNNRGIALEARGRRDEALASYDRAAALKPGDAMVHFNRGNVLYALRRHAEALAAYDRTIALQSDFAEAHNNRGNALKALTRHAEALASYDRALTLKPDYAGAHTNRGAALCALRRYAEALASHERALALQPDYAEAYNNRGGALSALRRHDEALAACDRALALDPDCAEASSTRGSVLNELRQHDEALASYDRAIALQPDNAEFYYLRGTARGDAKRYDEALTDFERAYSLRPDYEFLFGQLVRAKMTICDWRDLKSQVAGLVRAVEQGEKACSPFLMLGVSDSAAVQKKAAEIYVQAECSRNDSLPAIAKRARQAKIRLGYFSSSAFYNHARASLVAELFERHDRTRFDLTAFSFRSDRNDEARQRTGAAFDRFIDVDTRSDEEVALLARELGIDIAVDLNGYLQYTRQGIFALRAAPIQVSYVAYAGTTGSDYIDYLIADHTVVPESHRPYFTERIVRMPHAYQPNDTKRRIAEKEFTRAELGLPESGFVYCSFNNTYKFTPDIFDCWMRILRQVSGSVLWLYTGNGAAQVNLRNEARRRGVEGERVIFAPPMPLPEHMVRHRLADLFLDTLPYNAHTTASDALWAGLPVLTQVGEAFAARVAASLLNAIGLPELVTTTRDAYEALAVELATNPAKLAAIKCKLAENRLTQPLFDTPLYAKHLEAAYTTMYDRYQAGLPPDHIDVPGMR